MTRLLKNPPKGPHFEVKISTWMKDSHGLYDYEAQEDSYRTETLYTRGNSCKIYRDNNRFETFSDAGSKMSDAGLPMVAELIVSKSKANPQFTVRQPVRKEEANPDISPQAKTSYLVIRDYNRNGTANRFPLRPGHILKLGRVEYMVIESKNDEETSTLRDTNHFEETNGVFEVSKHRVDRAALTEQGERNCKVCLCDEETEDDPLISPCNCKGSCMLIHVGCLRTWINSKVKKELKGVAISYNFTKFECEICKFPFPKVVRVGLNDVEMMTINKPDRPYIILESLCNKQENKEERCLHLIATQENTPIKIGRGHDCEIRITDISVSRKHAEMILSEGEFYITDTKAKFGTLIKVEEDYHLTPGKAVKIQCGRSVFEFKAKSSEAEEVDTE